MKDVIKCCHWARTTNIGLLYPKARNNIGGNIPTDVPQPKYWEYVSLASLAGLTPVQWLSRSEKKIMLSVSSLNGICICFFHELGSWID